MGNSVVFLSPPNHHCLAAKLGVDSDLLEIASWLTITSSEGGAIHLPSRHEENCHSSASAGDSNGMVMVLTYGFKEVF